MKTLLLTLTLTVVFFSTNAWGASTEMPIGATIINLTTVPIEEAIAFCDERNLACPALREKYEMQVQQIKTEESIDAVVE